jgi:aminoglycoside phosphotransferase (APT) family kinase protein
VRARPSARLYWYRIECDGTSSNVVVKIHADPADIETIGDAGQPRLVEPLTHDIKYAQEYKALALLQQHFAALNDPRFGAIPVLDRIDPLRAIVMRDVDGQPLNRQLPQLSRLRPLGPSQALRIAIFNAGAWLRAYHQLEAAEAVTRQANREDFVSSINGYCAHLGRTLSRPAFFAGLAEGVASAAQALLPDELPLALSHGDFAMRNVLVGPTGRVFVFDTRAAWRAPIYDDLAKFGLAMRFARPQVYSHGLAFSEGHLRVAEQCLLAGYFGGDAVPKEQIDLYTLLLVFDKWSFELRQTSRGPRMRAAVKARFINSWFDRQARYLLARVA